VRKDEFHSRSPVGGNAVPRKPARVRVSSNAVCGPRRADIRVADLTEAALANKQVNWGDRRKLKGVKGQQSIGMAFQFYMPIRCLTSWNLGSERNGLSPT
jgi:hypothetical protein